MNEEAKKAIEEYRELLKKFNVETSGIVNDEGKIIVAGKRWVLMDASAFPAFMIKTTEDVVGRIAKEFVYWFGYGYGEKVAERQKEMGLTNDQALKVVFAVAACHSGWGIVKVEEIDFDKPYMKIKVFNDFESESAEMIGGGADRDLSFIKGVGSGLISGITGKKIIAKVINADNYTIMEFREWTKAKANT